MSVIKIDEDLRKNCPMRSEIGNCLPIGGFCTSNNDLICKAMHEAYAMGKRSVSVRKEIPESPHPDGDTSILCCPNCGSGEYLDNYDGNENDYCGQCGQKINWNKKIKN